MLSIAEALGSVPSTPTKKLMNNRDIEGSQSTFIFREIEKANNELENKRP